MQISRICCIFSQRITGFGIKIQHNIFSFQDSGVEVAQTLTRVLFDKSVDILDLCKLDVEELSQNLTTVSIEQQPGITVLDVVKKAGNFKEKGIVIPQSEKMLIIWDEFNSLFLQ